MLQAPLLALHLLKSHNEAITRIPEIVSYAVREKGMEYKGELWMQALELLRLAKRHISRQSDVE